MIPTPQRTEVLLRKLRAQHVISWQKHPVFSHLQTPPGLEQASNPFEPQSKASPLGLPHSLLWTRLRYIVQNSLGSVELDYINPPGVSHPTGDDEGTESRLGSGMVLENDDGI